VLGAARSTAKSLREEIGRALADDHRGERLREGLTIAIAGPPNAGKSSLLNRIARREAAIVSPYPGTTRDVIAAVERGTKTYGAAIDGNHDTLTRFHAPQQPSRIVAQLA